MFELKLQISVSSFIHLPIWWLLSIASRQVALVESDKGTCWQGSALRIDRFVDHKYSAIQITNALISVMLIYFVGMRILYVRKAVNSAQ